jgi:hypothetical protein
VTTPVLGDALNDRGDICDASASHADGHAASGTNLLRKPAPLELMSRFGADVPQTAIREALADEKKALRQHQAGSS